MTRVPLTGAGSGGFKVTDVPQSEGDALIWFYNHTSGPSWTDHTNWLVTPTVDDWFGVTVAGGHVTQVDLGGNNLNGDTGAWPIEDLSSLTILYLDANPSLSGDIGGWAPPASLQNLFLYATGLSGDVSGWTLWAALASLYLYASSISGDISSWTLPAGMKSLRCYSSGISGTPVISSNTAMREYYYQDCGLIQANVNAILLGIYNRRAAFAYATPGLNVGGTNDAPSGVYQDATPPTTGLEYVYKLANDPDAEGFNKWTITYTGGVAP